MRYFKALVLAVAAVLLAIVLAPPAHAEVSFDLAYSNLSQHGSWLVSAQYGRVWQPREYNQEWNPYYDGHWVNTDLGWTWVSDYEWGAIPYHYGTWVADPDAGWVWIPGEIWAPSWVTFRTGPDYIGWAPVPPGFSVGVSIELGGPSSFIFVSSRDFLAPRLRASIIPRERTNVFINNTTVVNNIVIQNNVVVNRGPDVTIVEKATGHSIRQERIETVARVAPFENVNRAQLAVGPERMKKGLRASEQIPASRALPVSDPRASGERKTAPADAPTPVIEPPAARPNAQEPATQPAQTPPGKDKPNAQQNAQSQAADRANAQQSAREQAKAKAAAQQSARAEANAKTKADQAAKATAQQSARAEVNAKAKADQAAKATAQQSARAEANAKAKADQAAKAEANAKAKADAKSRKRNPDKQDPNSVKGAAMESSQGTHP